MMPAAIETAFALGLVVPWELLYRADGNRITTFLTAAQECPLLAQNGHHNRAQRCLLLGVKRTSRLRCGMSASDPKRTSSEFFKRLNFWNCPHAFLWFRNLLPEWTTPSRTKLA